MFFRLCSIPLLAVFFYSCSNNERPVLRKEQATTINKNLNPVMRYKGITIRLHQLLYCRYPAHDPVYLQKKSTKLLLMDISVRCDKNISSSDKAFIIPTGATIWDNRGNEYEASPQAVAMAQNNHCIKGDDIESYNAIWNAALKTGETKRAFVLGFELPEDAVPSKLCWNKAWEERDLFFVLTDSGRQ
jgi:hypothetical protein